MRSSTSTPHFLLSVAWFCRSIAAKNQPFATAVSSECTIQATNDHRRRIRLANAAKSPMERIVREDSHT